ncbi:MAG: hypothetical protein PHX78_07290 [bacterium]|nr:hypothetical protein [bacterium]
MIGKMAIAYILTKYEDKHKAIKTENWYRFLLNKMVEDTEIDTFSQNKVSFVTFNYDRSLEHFLYTTLSHYSEDITSPKVIEIINQIPIIHLYGQLDPLPWQGENGREYGAPLEEKHLRGYIKNLSIIFEDMNAEIESRFKNAYDLLIKADTVYILGFGFDSDNIARLKLKEIFPQEAGGTAYKFENQQKIKEIKDKFFETEKKIYKGFLLTDKFPQQKGIELINETVYDFLINHAKLD